MLWFETQDVCRALGADFVVPIVLDVFDRQVNLHVQHFFDGGANDICHLANGAIARSNIKNSGNLVASLDCPDICVARIFDGENRTPNGGIVDDDIMPLQLCE
jgi:hypothetical protein